MQRIKQVSHNMFASLTVRNYKLYFTGQAISLCGTWMQTIGQTWLVLKLTNSGTALGIATALQFLPVLFLGPWGGVIVDRFSKRKLLYITQTTAGILSLVLGVLIVTHLVQIWMVYLFALGLGFVRVIDNPTRQTFVLEMVGKEHLSNAVSLNSIEVNLARVIGPSIGGVLIAVTGLAPLFFIDAVSYIAVISMLFLMRENELFIAPLVPRAKGQLREGFQYVSSRPILRDSLIMMSIIGIFAYEFTVILPLFAQFTFHGNAGTYAALTAAMGSGSVIGGLFIASRKKSSTQTLVLGAFLFGISIIIASLAPTLVTALIAMVFVGACSINFTAVSNTTLQLESDAAMRGRVMALWTVAFLGSTPIGGPIIGWIGEHIGPRWGLGIGGVAALVAGMWGVIKLKVNVLRTISPAIEHNHTDATNADERIL